MSESVGLGDWVLDFGLVGRFLLASGPWPSDRVIEAARATILGCTAARDACAVARPASRNVALTHKGGPRKH